MRFFVKIQFDVHNPGMATDRHQAPSYPLRMPEELKAKVASFAAESGRSLHAELLFRLEESFRLNQGDADLARTRMTLAEVRTRESVVQGEALFLGWCVAWLLNTVKENGITFEGEAKGLEVDAKKFADKVKAYERELNPDLRLEEYRQAVEETRSLAKYWHPKARPWPGAVQDPKKPSARKKPKPKP